MATKAKETGIVGKEKKVQSSNSPITSTKKPTTKSTPTTPEKPTSSPSVEKQVPNYLKPTLSSVRLESHSFKLTKNDALSRATLNRRRSFDKPPSPSRLPKQTHHPSLSRQHKALVSPGPRDRALPLRSSSAPIKTTTSTTNPSKPISERLSKTPKEGKTQSLLAKSGRKSGPSVSTSTTKKVINSDHASAISTSATKRSSNAETTEATISVETEPVVKEAINEEVGEVKEAIDEEVEKVENQNEQLNEVENIPPRLVNSEDEHDHENDQKLEESDQPHVEDDDDKVIPTELKQEEEEVKEEKKEDDNTNQDESNTNESHLVIDHSITEEQVEVKEKEGGEEGGVITEEDHLSELGVVKIEDHKNEINNEEVVEEEKEGVEEGTSEEVNKLTEEQEHGEDEQEEAKVESTKSKQIEVGGGVQGNKKESPISNDVIEETAGKLLEARKNKVRALAGAFQTVIDHQTK
ncbi:microtubule-associated protein RP/EB family member 1-like [Abrus precatorius]|uniref:Microtubule-associated protein RP/EB family member 1-like n=1 Tax=Abrus precatorius TaxID=3816 RepID=A0A8B8LKU6_ABRPR|nr:microtubule-associated protein RP/EB family member 1-like [Abrus precatorius]